MSVLLTEHIFGYPVSCAATVLDEGLHVLLTGGCRTHIGSISVAERGQELLSTRYPRHKDHVIGDKWAQTLADRFGVRVVVVCGIHYDNLTTDGIDQIVKLSDRMLEELSIQLNK